MNTTFSLRHVLLALGALFLLFVLRQLLNPLFSIAVPLLLLWLLVSWNQPERASLLFGTSPSKGRVRAGLAGAMIACALLSSATSPGRSEGEPNAPRLAQGDVLPASPRNSTPAPGAQSVATPVNDRKAEERIRIADARMRQAEAAERRAKRAQEKLEHKQQQEQERREQREAQAEEKRREAARLAAMPTATPVDPNAPKKDIFGYHALKVRVELSDEGVTFFNDDTFDYTSLSLRLNSGLLTYGYRTSRSLIPANSSFFVPYRDFSQPGGERFSPLTHKVRWVHIYCQTHYGRASWAAQNQ